MARRQRQRARSDDTYELSDDAKQDMIDVVTCWNGADSANALVYDPTGKQRIGKSGAWAMITRQIGPLERNLHEHLRVARIFFVEHVGGADDYGFMPDGSYKVLCRSPWGDVVLWPYEYSTIDPTTVVQLWTAGEIRFHPTAIDNARMNEITFYARSRGIGLADAAVMALGTLTGPVGWFEPREDLAAEAEAMERHVRRPLSARRQRRG